MQFTYFFLFRLFDLLPYSLSMQVKKKKKRERRRREREEEDKERRRRQRGAQLGPQLCLSAMVASSRLAYAFGMKHMGEQIKGERVWTRCLGFGANRGMPWQASMLIVSVISDGNEKHRHRQKRKQEVNIKQVTKAKPHR